MNKGSKRVTLRIGDEMLELVKQALAERINCSSLEPWTVTDFIMQAIADKLNHQRRSRKLEERVSQIKVSEYLPREVTEE